MPRHKSQASNPESLMPKISATAAPCPSEPNVPRPSNPNSARLPPRTAAAILIAAVPASRTACWAVGGTFVPGKYATEGRFLGGSREACERTDHPRQHLGRHVELEILFVKEGNQHFRSSGADHCMSAWIGGVRGGIADLGKPIGIGVGVRVAVRSGRADRGHRAPKIEGIFRIVEGDDAIGETKVQQREQPVVSRGGQLMRQGRSLSDLVLRLALLWDGSALTRSVELAVSHYGPQPTQPVPACSRGAELGAIQICRALAVNSKFPCRHQLLGHDTATTYHGVKVNERLWPYSCSYVPYVCQRMRRRLGHRQSTALARQKREDDA